MPFKGSTGWSSEPLIRWVSSPSFYIAKHRKFGSMQVCTKANYHLLRMVVTCLGAWLWATQMLQQSDRGGIPSYTQCLNERLLGNDTMFEHQQSHRQNKHTRPDAYLTLGDGVKTLQISWCNQPLSRKRAATNWVSEMKARKKQKEAPVVWKLLLLGFYYGLFILFLCVWVIIRVFCGCIHNPFLKFGSDS